MTMLWDGAILALLWLGLTWLRTWLREVWTLDLIAGQAILEEVDFGSHATLALPIVICWLFWLSRLGTYRAMPIVKPARLLGASILALCTVLALLFSVRATDALSRSLCFGFAAMSSPAIWWGRRALLWLQSRGALPSPSWSVLFVGSMQDLMGIRAAISEHASPGHDLINPVIPHPDAAHPDALSQALDQQVVDHVLVGPGWTDASLRVVARSCEEVGIPFSVDANFLGLYRARPYLWSLNSRGVLTFSTTPGEGALAIKRLVDLSGAAILLVLAAPIMALTALAIRLSDKGPAIFEQTRVGQNGRPFRFFKFRSMVVNASQNRDLAHLNEQQGPVFKIKKDPRVTRLGSYLRRSSLDELPQLWNVLRGDMSLVGPRPPLPAEVVHYERWQLRRLSMKPGLTCIWQVSGRSEVDFESWMRQDLEYIDNWSLSLDFKLLAQTVPAVLSGSGAH